VIALVSTAVGALKKAGPIYRRALVASPFSIWLICSLPVRFLLAKVGYGLLISRARFLPGTPTFKKAAD